MRLPPSKCIKSITAGGITSDGAVNDLAISYSGTMMFAANGNVVKIWDLNKYVLYYTSGAGETFKLDLHRAI